MAKATSEAMPAAQVAEVDRLARKLWRYGEESFSNAWLRAYINYSIDGFKLPGIPTQTKEKNRK